MSSRKIIGSAASVAVVVVGLAGLYASAAALPVAQPAEPLTAASASLLLRENLAELEEQQEQELELTREVLELPAGASWGPSEDFGDIADQLDSYEVSASARSATTYTVDAPVLEEYEDGYFSSLAAYDWQCAWLSAGVASFDRGDVSSVEFAVDMLRSFPVSYPDLAESFPDYGLYLELYVDPLVRGSADGPKDMLTSCAVETLVAPSGRL